MIRICPPFPDPARRNMDSTETADRSGSDAEPVASPSRLRETFDAPAPLTVGIEEEVMLLDGVTLDLNPRAEELLAAAGGDGRFKLELPAAQVELVTLPCATVSEAAAQLESARASLHEAASGIGRLAGAGAHPTAGPEGVLNHHERYRVTREEFGPVAHAQLVFGLHVHVRVAGAERAVAVHNALRSYLPQLAALAANAPFHAGRDTGLASVRPKISELLPRQGVPPTLADLDELAEAWRWGAAAGSMPRPNHWWWELRLHPTLGTIEVRVPDQQTTVAQSAGVAAVIHALVATLAERHDEGLPLAVHPTWRIAENRWSAGRHGLAGTMADLDIGERRPTRDSLRALLEWLEPAAGRAGCLGELAAADRLVTANGSERQRQVAAQEGLSGLVAWLADSFLAVG
ncbi:MAG: YbdK family carboxylate-amine ligase [Actinomycetota bacterium]|nr:YbdK family carboxylate-amine ligase [Actinomycetota bacterium]